MTRETPCPHFEFDKDKHTAVVYISEKLFTKECRTISELRDAIVKTLTECSEETKEQQMDTIRPMLFLAHHHIMPVGKNPNILYELEILPEHVFMAKHWNDTLHLFWQIGKRRKRSSLVLATKHYFYGSIARNGNVVLRVKKLSFYTLDEGTAVVEKLWNQSKISQHEKNTMLIALYRKFQ